MAIGRFRGLATCTGSLILSMTAGCAVSHSSDPPSWDTFRKQAERVIDGRRIYLVEGNMAVTLEQLRDYYEQHIVRSEIGIVADDLAVNQVNSRNDVWTDGAQLGAAQGNPEEKFDLNGDGKADVCGRGGAGINCAVSTGSSFGAVIVWVANFSDPLGWNTGPEYYSTIRFPDVNGDGRADVCGRGGAGIYCALNTGSGFGPVNLWVANFSDAFGWNAGPEYYSTIRFPDVNGDG